MTTESTLSAFLLDRYAEDEGLAQHPHAARATHTIGCSIHPQGLEDTWCDCGSPARVLAECDAKRRILAEHPHTEDVIAAGYTGPNHGIGCEVCHDWDGVTEGNGFCATLRLLALPYADHPDYRQEWKP